MDKNIVALLDTHAYTIKVRYQHSHPGSSAFSSYTYVTNLRDIEVGDYVMVPTALSGKNYITFDGENRITVGKVTEVHEVVDIQPNSEVEFKWVIGKVDLSAYNDLMARNKELAKTLTAAYTLNLRSQFAQTVMNSLPVEARDEVLKLIA